VIKSLLSAATRRISRRKDSGRTAKWEGAAHSTSEGGAPLVDARRILDALGDAIIAADREGRIVYINGAAERLLGWPVAELLGQPLQSIQPTRFHAPHVAGFARFLTSGESQLVGQRIAVAALRRDGREVEVEFVLTSVDPTAFAGNAWVVAALRESGPQIDLVAMTHAAILTEASEALAATLDEKNAFDHLAALAIPRLAAWCTVNLFPQQWPGTEGDTGQDGRTLTYGPSPLNLSVADLTVSLVARERTFGHASFGAPPQHHYTDAERSLLTDLVGRIALAVDRSRLLAEAQAAQRALQGQATRLGAVAAASQAFAEASLDLNRLVLLVARRTAELIGDGCIVRLTAPELIHVTTSSAFHPNPEQMAMLRTIQDASPEAASKSVADPAAQPATSMVGGDVIADEPRSLLNREFWPYFDRFGIATLLAAPLVVRGNAIGTLLTWRDPGKPHFAGEDRTFLHDIAARGALAIDNARLYQEQVEARTRIYALAAERSLLLGQIADGVIIADAEGRIIFVNEAAHRLHGRAEHDIAIPDYSTTYGLFTVDGDPYPPDQLPLARAVARGETVTNTDWRIRRPDGTEISAQGSAAPLLAENGERIGAILTLHDVTERRALERLKDEFILSASHDLRTPLTGIKGWTQILLARFKHEPDRERDLAALAIIDAQASAMQYLIDQLLETSRLQLGQQQLPLEIRFTNLNALVKRQIYLHRTLSPHHQITFTPNHGEEVTGYWDTDRLAQVINNLLTNALKYSLAGAPVELAIRKHDDHVSLTVSDRGIGIPIEALPRVFDQFYRASNVTTTAYGEMIAGLGVGLFNSRRIAERHRGQLTVESVEGEGSRFTLLLPLDSRHAVG
jgi:PAS domain S-box-containing protein